MAQPTQHAPKLIWWGRGDPAYSRNAVIRQAVQSLGWLIHDVHPSKAVSLGVATPRALPDDAQLVWVPCFRQRDVVGASRWASKRGLPLVIDPLISAYDKQVYERRKFAVTSLRASRLLAWERRRFALADVLVADTRAHAQYFQQCFDVPPDRTAVIPVGADERHFVPQPRSDTADRRIEVLFYGSFIALQGPEAIVKAAAMCNHVNWCLLGDGPLRGTCEAMARGYDHIRFEPWIAYEKLPTRIGQADILLGVFSESAKAGRVVPNKLYQAMACARPVVTRCPQDGAFAWPDEAVPDRSGVTVVPPGDASALAQAVDRLASDPALMAAHGDAARSTYERYYSSDRVMQAVESVLSQAIGGGAAQ